MRLRERDPEPTAEQFRDLEAIDRALAGESVDAELAELAALAADLRAERSDPDEEWRRLMDERAAAGFRRKPISSEARRWIERLRELRPSRVLVPAGAAATLAVAVAVGLATQPATVTTERAPEGRQAAEGPATAEVAPEDGSLRLFGGDDDEAAPAEDGEELSLAAQDRRERAMRRDARRGDAVAPEGGIVAPLPPPGGGTAPGVERRRVERGAYLELSTGPGEVRSVTNRTVEITRAADGIVLSSQLSEQNGASSSTLQLQVPTRNLDSVLDQLTGLADVGTLNESTLDITRPFVSARDRLEDARARRRALLEAIANADDETTIADLERRLQRTRRQISRAEARFESVARRARMSSLSVAVVGDPNAGTGFSWGEALDDAGKVLLRVAAIMLITAAIVVPIALVAALLLLAVAAYRRWSRERALES